MRIVLELKLDPIQFGEIMAALDDLKASVTRLQTSANAIIAAQSATSVPAADVATQTTAINAVSDQLDAETKVLTGG